MRQRRRRAKIELRLSDADERNDALRADIERRLSDAYERNDALRADIELGLTDGAERSDQLRAEIARALTEAAERHGNMQAEIEQALTRLERWRMDSLTRRAIRLARGAMMVARSSVEPRSRRSLVRSARVMVDSEARQVWSDCFDAAEYLDANVDVSKANVPAGLHYLLIGFREDREPSSRFSGVTYLMANRDIAEADFNPLVHYALMGRREGRPSPGRSRRTASLAPRVNSLWPRQSPLVSVVIPCFNYGRSLRTALESVLSQTWDDLEVIVVEGGSTDTDSIAATRELEAEGPPRTTFYYRDSRRLAGDNRNHGISQARGRYVICLDPDDILEPVYLEVAVFLAEAYHYDLVYPSVQCFGESDETWLVSDTSFGDMLRANSIPTVALFRRSAWVESGGYRDWGIGGSHVPEDWAFWARLIGMGYRSKSIRQPLMRYHVHAGSLSAVASSDWTVFRDSIGAANADLLATTSYPETTWDRTQAANPYCNLLTRAPVSTDRGSILIAMPYITIGGAERLMASLAEALTADGYRVIVVTSLPTSGKMPDGTSLFRGSTAHVYQLPDLFTELSQHEAFLLYLLERYSVDTLLIVGSRLVYESLPDIRRDRPNMGVVDQLFNAVGHRGSHREFAAFVDLAVVPSNELRSLLVDDWKVPTEVSVIPHAVRISGHEHARPRVGDRKAPDRVPIIGFFGRWSEEKGPDLFLEMARTVSRESDATFVMTGDGPMHEQVHRLIGQYRLSGRIRTPGFVPDATSAMAEVDIVVIPSRLDGMPLVILEAMALGKPVVASAVGSMPEVIDDARTGYLCQPGDMAAFAARVLALSRDPALRDRIGAAAGREYAARYSWERVYHLYLDAFARASTLAAERTAASSPSA